MRLFEYILQEADKTRFIEPAVKAAMEDDDIGLTQDQADDMFDRFKKFANSGAADKYNIKWQQKPINLYVDLFHALSSYYDSGGSLKDKKIATKQDPKLVFQNSYLLDNEDYVLLDELENDNFLFVVPMNHKACMWINSFECGGQGAKWCLGYERDESYWIRYVSEGNLFCLAFNKKEYANPTQKANNLKFMIQFTPYVNKQGCRVWLQTDRESETFGGYRAERKFGHTFDEIAMAVVKAIMKYGQDSYYKVGRVWDAWVHRTQDGKIFEDYDEDDVFEVSLSELISERMTVEDLNDMIDNSGTKVVELNGLELGAQYGGRLPLCLTEKGKFIENYNKPEIELIKILCNICTPRVKKLIVKNVYADIMYLSFHADKGNLPGNRYLIERPDIFLDNCFINKLVVTEHFINNYGNNGVLIINPMVNELIMSEYSSEEKAQEDLNSNYIICNEDLKVFMDGISNNALEGKELHFD